MNITFTKPIRWMIKEGDLYLPSIIALGKSPWLVNDKGIIQYKYMIYVNLWLVEIKHSWLSKIKNEPIEDGAVE